MTTVGPTRGADATRGADSAITNWRNQPEGEVIHTTGINAEGLDPTAAKRAGGDVSAILASIAAKEVSSLQVVNKMIQRAEDCTAYTNCVVKGAGVDLYASARSLAAEHDQLNTKGPLHGLPFSVKECYLLEGTDSTIGLGKQVNKPSQQTAGLVRQLQHLGAIPFCKTNVPQIMYSFECSNPVVRTAPAARSLAITAFTRLLTRTTLITLSPHEPSLVSVSLGTSTSTFRFSPFTIGAAVRIHVQPTSPRLLSGWLQWGRRLPRSSRRLTIWDWQRHWWFMPHPCPYVRLLRPQNDQGAYLGGLQRA